VALRLKPVGDQTMVITGASSGIGLAVARAAVARGAAVVIAARNEEALEVVAEELRGQGGRVATCPADVAKEGDVERIAGAADRAFGGFDTWVNNAAVTVYGTLEEIGMEEHRRIFDVDYFGQLRGSLVALRHLRARGGGAIINMGSILSDFTIIKQGPYCAAKHAIRSMTETLRMDVERDGLPISVTLIKPTGIHTPFPEHARNHMKLPPRIPQLIYAPELVADAVLFAAEHPRRQLYVGGNGFLLSLTARLFPRMTDRVMEAVMVRAQQSRSDPGDPRLRDNLYEPRPDGDVESHQKFFFRRRSLFLEAQKRPALAFGLCCLAGVAAYALSRSGRVRLQANG